MLALGAILAVGVGVGIGAAPAAAAIPASLSDRANCTEHVEGGLDYWFCDDGVPEAGGTRPNHSGARAVTVPARYDGYVGLPAKAADAGAVPGADRSGQIALDVDVSIPRSAPPRGGYPVLFFMHGCCGGDKTNWQADELEPDSQRWHYSNAWFASRGYVVVNYTARGFVNGDGNGSTGQTQLNSRRYEINDYQHLACQVAGNAGRFSRISGRRVRINPKRVVTTGGSYSGAFSWMTMTDPRWRCPGSRPKKMQLAVTAPMYGWTDLLYSLVPTGAHRTEPGQLPRVDGCDSGPLRPSGAPCPDRARQPVGIPKSSIIAGLYASGKVGLGARAPHTTFPPKIDQALACLSGPYPPLPGPLCDGPISETLPEFLRERSAYYQARFFRQLAGKRSWRVPVFNVAPLTDPLFTPIEHIRMINRLRSIDRRYPIQTYAGDVQHFVQNKTKEWADLCGPDHHVCLAGEYPNGGGRPADFNWSPVDRRRTGITTRLNRFLDHYARPKTNRRQARPRFDSTVALQVCPQNATGRFPADEPGPRFRASTHQRQAPERLRIKMPGSGITSSSAPSDHALAADPIINERVNARACAPAEGPAGPGVAVFESEPLGRAAVMIGPTRVRFAVSGPSGDAEQLGLQLSGRLYDLAPDGETAMVDRGLLRMTRASGEFRLDLHGNAWRWRRGHRMLLELTQDDSPYLHASAPLTSLRIDRVRLAVPIR